MSDKALNIAFWNVYNLFEPGVVDRGPKSDAELKAKTEAVYRVVGQFFNGAGPDLLALAEVGTEAIVQGIRSGLGSKRYGYVWVPPVSARHTGLALLTRTEILGAERPQLPDIYRPTLGARPQWMVVQCRLAGTGQRFLVVVNHWKSRLRLGGDDDAEMRLTTARSLGDRLARETAVPTVIALGDFNAEPFEAPFSDTALRATRWFSTALWSQATPAHLYNTAWRFLDEPEQWPLAGASDYREPRPKTSHGDGTPVILDHLLVSGQALRGGPLRLREESVVLYHDDDNSEHKTTGKLVPLRWTYDEKTAAHSGVSDHFPLLAAFEIVEE